MWSQLSRQWVKMFNFVLLNETFYKIKDYSSSNILNEKKKRKRKKGVKTFTGYENQTNKQKRKLSQPKAVLTPSAMSSNRSKRGHFPAYGTEG